MMQQRLSSQHSSSPMSHTSNPNQTTLGVHEYESVTLPRNKNNLPHLWFCYNPAVLCPFPDPQPEDNKCLELSQPRYYGDYYCPLRNHWHSEKAEKDSHIFPFVAGISLCQ